MNEFTLGFCSFLLFFKPLSLQIDQALTRRSVGSLRAEFPAIQPKLITYLVFRDAPKSSLWSNMFSRIQRKSRSQVLRKRKKKKPGDEDAENISLFPGFSSFKARSSAALEYGKHLLCSIPSLSFTSFSKHRRQPLERCPLHPFPHSILRYCSLHSSSLEHTNSLWNRAVRAS